MTTARPAATKLISVGNGLPRLSFHQIGAPGMISWSQGPMASVIFIPHRWDCEACASYLDVLGSAAEGLREWATRAMVVWASGDDTTGSPAGRGSAGVLRLADVDGAGRARLGVGDAQAAIIQADRWGAVYQVEVVGPSAAAHAALPAGRDLVALAQFIDIQCPECAIPSKEWMDASPYPLG